MNVKINNKDFEYYDNLVVNLRYNAVASSFSFGVAFNPADVAHREIFRPFAYPSVVVQHNGETLVTGTLWPTNFTDAPEDELTGVAGYSKTGVLEDSSIPKEAYPIQYNGLTLKQIAERLIQPFGIKLIVDSSVAKLANSVYDTSTASETSGVKAFLSELCGQKNIILTHDEKGNLVLTKTPAVQTPVFDFVYGMPGTKLDLQLEGQSIHSDIIVRKQASIDGGNAGHSSIKNPYGAALYRPLSIKQSSGTDNDTALAAKNKLAEELRAIKLTIQTDRWDVNGRLFKPGMIVTAKADELYLFSKTNFFIESVDFSGNNTSETATLTCVLPEKYTGGTPKNIFL